MTTDNESTNDEGNADRTIQSLSVRLLAVAVLVAVVWFLRPLFHPLLYRIVHSPALLIFGGGVLLVAAFLFFSPPLESDQPSSTAKFSVLTTAAIVLLVVGAAYGVPAAVVEERTLAQETMAEAEIADDFPEVNEENARITPQAVSDVQTRGSVSYRQHQLGESDIARMDDGRLAWSYPVEPDPFRVRLSGHQRGVFLTDMTTMESPDMQAYDEHEFEHGQNMLLYRSADWNLKQTDYWSQYNDEPIEFVHDGEAYMAYPKTGHEWQLSPIPHTVPVWDGVALVHQDGTIDHLSPEQAQESEVLTGQRLYPLDVTEARMDSLRYRNGIINQLSIVGSFEGVVEPASMPSEVGNHQPFVIDLEDEQMSYVMAMEPHGDSTRGLDEVWFTDAETGEFNYYSSGRESLRGPERAMGIARGTDTRTDWGPGGDAMAVEPIPVTVDDELWWHTKVVTPDQTDVVRNIFVNAHSSSESEDAAILYDTAEVYDFIAGTDLEDLDDAEAVDEDGDEIDTEPAPDAPDVAYYLVIYDEDGDEIDRIAIEPGQDVAFESEHQDDDRDE
ncbi:hypothetical protein [Natronobacterium gregoryi]|uniref:Uncharacterized protein n=2 Tax=Natronobacterium gregoryi TaxID=44930 RepID=L0ALG3_NATGS|nr:hypothetical protein [Natronobacterium gregoryi]AFZ74606.1 hypothetical protein Natgr_3487 [Natronobacterium gregoryi SP2]ELY72572.1 hypothetical protein C490_03248 [Natronobacterium gregoryi SP2]PLK19793.1 hypothetical protein CYV19_12860 [Natronobacterium gregoryi SP2]SFJ30351.1 hypothetical protein SAMN05443661_12124 [Natronobacterium gregoryi]